MTTANDHDAAEPTGGPADRDVENNFGQRDGGADGVADSEVDLDAAEEGLGAAEPGVVGGT
jgi:hypothetical protein